MGTKTTFALAFPTMRGSGFHSIETRRRGEGASATCTSTGGGGSACARGIPGSAMLETSSESTDRFIAVGPVGKVRASPRRMRLWLVWMLPFALVLSVPSGAAAGDASALADGDAGFDGAPLGCDGALCDTTNGGSCGVAGRVIGQSRLDSISVALLISGGLLYGRRRPRTGTPRPASGQPRAPYRPSAVRSI